MRAATAGRRHRISEHLVELAPADAADLHVSDCRVDA
jgi:hypothetical protein